MLAQSCWYPALLVIGTLALRAQPPGRQRAWLAWLSTDLHNLASHPVRSLLGSGLVCEGDLVAWTVLALIGLAGVGARFGAPLAAGLVIAVHVLATLASQAVIGYRIGTGRVPATARVMTDVGPSYLVVAALIAALLYGRRPAKVAAGLGFALLAPSLFGGLAEFEVSAMGHVASIVLAALLGAAAARRIPPPARDRRAAGRPGARPGGSIEA